MKRNLLFVYASIILTMLFWSLSYIWTKIIYQFYRPITTIYLRTIIASAILWSVGKLMKRIQPVAPKDWKYILFLTFLHPLLYFLCESFSLLYVSPTIAAVLISMIPLVIPLAAYFFLQERVSRLNIIGIIVSFIGVVVLITHKDFSLSASPLGLLLLIGAVIIGVAFTITLRKLASRYNAFTLVTYQNLLGILWFTPLFFLIDLNHFLGAKPGTQGLLSLFLLALLASAAAFIMYTYALNILGASRASVFSNSIPVFTAALSWLILDEVLTTRMLIGIAIVIAGLFVSQIRKKSI